MKIMLSWKFPTEATYTAGMKQFLETGGPPPEGLKTIGRWHAPGSKYGFHLVEGDPALAAELVAQWNPFCDVEATPVLDDEEASSALRKAGRG